MGVCVKAKSGFDGFERELLDEGNSRRIDPLDDASVTSCFNSEKSKGFPLLGECKKNPMVEFCVKKRCEPAEYSPVVLRSRELNKEYAECKMVAKQQNLKSIVGVTQKQITEKTAYDVDEEDAAERPPKF